MHLSAIGPNCNRWLSARFQSADKYSEFTDNPAHRLNNRMFRFSRSGRKSSIADGQNRANRDKMDPIHTRHIPRGYGNFWDPETPRPLACFYALAPAWIRVIVSSRLGRILSVARSRTHRRARPLTPWLCRHSAGASGSLLAGCRFPVSRDEVILDRRVTEPIPLNG